MSKQMTPCEKLGYKVGDNFEFVGAEHFKFNAGDSLTLIHDDGSQCPFFSSESGAASVYLEKVRNVSSLKPAKQAMADAIYQNGGWLIAGDYNFVTSNHRGVVKFFHEKPLRNGCNWVGGSCSLAWVDLHQPLPNWHQTILSRDEYFTAYPEQVKVVNETEHKVEVEMKSESEMTIKVSDWHKNGGLPPVGEVCVFDPSGGECYFSDEELKASGNNVTVIAHTKYNHSASNVAVFRWDLDESFGVSTANATSFLPLRTEREKAIDEMAKVVGLNVSVFEVEAGKLYDAGYRKEVK